MKAPLHATAGALAMLLIAGFWLSTFVSEAFMDREAVLHVKRGILYGLALLIPLLMLAGASGFSLARAGRGRLAEDKSLRMRFIALNGLCVLLPAAVYLEHRAAHGLFDRFFLGVQVAELAAGLVQLVLLGLNFRDGLRLSGRLRPD